MGSKVAIVDYGLGNLFSVQQACHKVGMESIVTADPQAIMAADALILPGVGAFQHAMAAIERLGLVTVLCDFASSGRPFMGICLGMQLLLSYSEEFGTHRGLGIIEGSVVRLPSAGGENMLKLPNVGWAGIYPPPAPVGSQPQGWAGTILEDIACGEYMYFVHSYQVVPRNSEKILAVSSYGDFTFCATLQQGNIFGCQFHPEKSCRAGLKIYENFFERLH